jgi:hypothetical protein
MGLPAQEVSVRDLLRERNKERGASMVVVKNNRREKKLKQRYGTDTRKWTEKNRLWKIIAVAVSYFAQLVFVLGAGYLAYRLFWEYNFAGIVNTAGAIFFIIVVAISQYHTSDNFHDRWARGDFSVKFFILNFIVIWGVVAAIGVGGVFLHGNDSKADPSRYNNPEVAAIRSDVAANDEKIAKYQERVDQINSAPTTDKSYYVQGGSDKGQLRYNVEAERTKLMASIEQLESSNSAHSQMLASEYQTSARIDEGRVTFHEKVENSKVYARCIVTLIFLIAFEIARWYDSKWNENEYAEGVWEGRYHDPEYYAALKSAHKRKTHVMGKA